MAEQNTNITIVIPDLGDTSEANIVEVSVQAGERVEVDQTLVVLEGEKATMDVPSSHAGVVTEVLVSEGDAVSSGHAIVTLQAEGSADADAAASDSGEAQAGAGDDEPVAEAAQEQVLEIRIPDIGDSKDVTIIELEVQVGDEVDADATLLTLEGEKATMDVPSPYAGVIESLAVSVGDQVNGDDLVATIKVSQQAAQSTKTASSAPASAGRAAAPAAPSQPQPAAAAPAPISADEPQRYGNLYAGPVVRRLAREFGVDLSKVRGSGRKGRIQKSDLQAYVRDQIQRAQQGGGGGGLQVAEPPKVDFSRYGEVTTKPLNKIKRWTAKNLHRNWVMIPHVTQFDRADITELESHRGEHKNDAKAMGVRLTPLVFIMKALADTLKEFPNFNASLDATGENLILKQYYHLGVAVDTPNGLVVPVIRDVDQKSVVQLAQELVAISQKARDTGLTPMEMQGGTMTISSLGGIGGEFFTPIINAPDVAILGISKSQHQPQWDGDTWQPRLMLPLSLSYDHRVIDGADGARFMCHLTERLAGGMRDLDIAEALAAVADKQSDE